MAAESQRSLRTGVMHLGVLLGLPLGGMQLSSSRLSGGVGQVAPRGRRRPRSEGPRRPRCEGPRRPRSEGPRCGSAAWGPRGAPAEGASSPRWRPLPKHGGQSSGRVRRQLWGSCVPVCSIYVHSRRQRWGLGNCREGPHGGRLRSVGSRARSSCETVHLAVGRRLCFSLFCCRRHLRHRQPWPLPLRQDGLHEGVLPECCDINSDPKLCFSEHAWSKTSPLQRYALCVCT